MHAFYTVQSPLFSFSPGGTILQHITREVWTVVLSSTVRQSKILKQTNAHQSAINNLI